MMNIITSSPFVWFGLLAAMVALPILIHLINRLRHKQVRWAAMEFLLASHKKNRNWVWLKQLLLLLARIACLVLILMTVGQVGCNNDSMARFLGGNVTHHYILVDDSLSMADVSDGQSALDRARQTVGMIASRIAGRDNHRVTLLRFSQTASADLNSRTVDREIEQVMSDVAANVEATHLAIGPAAAIEMASQLVQQRSGENSIVYLLSDFRKGDWMADSTMRESFRILESQNAAVELIRCADSVSNNLAITSLEADGSVQVAGIPLMMTVQVTNYGAEPARKVQVSLQSAKYPDESTVPVVVSAIEPELNELPAVLIDEVAAGESVTRRFPVFFPQSGQHAIRACLQPDALISDDASWVVTRFSAAEKVLVIADNSTSDAKLISLALAPSGMTGLQVEQSSKAALRDKSVEQLAEYETIFLLDVDRLEELSVRNLREYVQGGGGVVFFSGPNTNLKYYSTELYDQGNGIFPLPLERTTVVQEQLDRQTADIVATRHPIFSSVLDVDYSPLGMVQIKQVCQPPLEWNADADNSVSVIATVRGDERLPLVVEKRIGNGTVIATTTSAGTQWNNWLRNPTFPATLLLMQDYAARGRNRTVRWLTGFEKTFELPGKDFRAEIEFVSPTGSADGFGFDRTTWKINAKAPDQPGTDLARQDGVPTAVLGATVEETASPGIYESWIQTIAAERQLIRFALNVNNDESKLDLATRGELASAAPDARIVGWERFGPNAGNNRGTSLMRILLVLLLIGLVAEQLLAWSSSYHPKTGKRTSGSVSDRRFQSLRRKKPRAA